jgi:hypothetical protein
MATQINLQGVNSETITIHENEVIELDNVDYIQLIENNQIRFSETDDFSDNNIGFILNFSDFYKSTTNKLFIKALKKDVLVKIQVKGV